MNQMGVTYSRVGLKEVCFWPLTVDSSSALTYGTKRSEVVESINFDIAPQTAEPDVQYAEDVESDVLYPDPELTGTLETKELPLSLRAWLLGKTTDTNGVMVENSADSPPYFAMGYKSEKRNGAFRYVQLLKCRAKEMSETFSTKAGKTITRQTDKIEITAIKRTNDGDWRYQVDSDNALFASALATFFDVPYTKAVEPYLTISAQPANASVTEGSISGALSVTVAAHPSGSPTYQWYKPTTPFVGSSDSTVAGATSASLTIPTNLTAGTHYFYCKIMLTGAITLYTYVAQVVVAGS